MWLQQVKPDAQHLAGCMIAGHRCALHLLPYFRYSMCLQLPWIHLCTILALTLHLKVSVVQHFARFHACLILKDQHVWWWCCAQTLSYSILPAGSI